MSLLVVFLIVATVVALVFAGAKWLPPMGRLVMWGALSAYVLISSTVAPDRWSAAFGVLCVLLMQGEWEAWAASGRGRRARDARRRLITVRAASLVRLGRAEAADRAGGEA